MQTMAHEEVQEWLYAINPLLAGQIRYVYWLSFGLDYIAVMVIVLV